MNSHPFSISTSFLFLFLLTITLLTPLSNYSSDGTTLVFKACAKQPLSDPTGIYSQSLSTIFGTLISQSSKSKFYKTTSSTSQSSITGLYQCRGDLSNLDCYNCVKTPILIDKLCGKPVAARIHLLGCYMLYEVSGFTQISGLQMIYKTCGASNAPSGSGFEEKRDSAFSSLESGVASGGGFYTCGYENVYVLGQCEGDLGSSDCGNCVKTTVQNAQAECGNSVPGQVYLHKCFISYKYYPNGAPKRSSPSSADDYSSPSSFSSSPSSGSEGKTGKTVIIILGGAAGVGFLVIFLLFARGLFKKHDDGNVSC